MSLAGIRGHWSYLCILLVYLWQAHEKGKVELVLVKKQVDCNRGKQEVHCGYET